jgi:hydroxyacylglutathione hydrolase
MDHISVTKIKNYPVDSNCYLIRKQDYHGCILIDPACEKGSSLHTFLVTNKLVLEYMILTHEHFDHISSVEYLRENYGCKVVSSAICSEYITNNKKNLSVFHDSVGFSCSPSDIIINENDYYFLWQDISIKFYLTPGHSDGGLCFTIGNNLFTGDTLLEKHKTIVKLPGGSKTKLSKSLEILTRVINTETVIYPGHGEAFKLSEIDASIMNQ